MLKRRQFLMTSAFIGISPYIEAKVLNSFEKKFKYVENTIIAVQEHMFPQASKLSFAKETNVIQFVFETISHDSYDKDIRVFVIEGAQELISRKKNFSSLSYDEKESVLRAYEKTSYGSTWLSRIMTLSMEGLFSDPIYGANVNKQGWKALNAYGGNPRPTIKYINV